MPKLLNLKIIIPLTSVALLILFNLFFFLSSSPSSNLSTPLIPILATFEKPQPTPTPLLNFTYHQPLISLPPLSSQSYLLIKFDNFFSASPQAQILAQLNPHTLTSIASLTKIMTALVVMDNMDLNQTVTITKPITQTEGASMHLKVGEIYTIKELLWGLILKSANDAAEALALAWPKGRTDFIHTMNQYAQRLNLNCTHFINPSGLDEDDMSHNTSCATDLAVLTWYIYYKHPFFRQITKTKRITLTSPTHQTLTLYNKLGLDKTYPGLIGVKSGNSYTANLAVIELLEKNNHHYLLILLNTLHPKNDVKAVFNYLFKTNY